MTPKRVTLVADELRGLQGGGLGTATTHLAIALARMGHSVEVLYVGAPPHAEIAADWARLYESAGVVIRTLPRSDEAVEPSFFGRMLDIERALRVDPPDVAITQDLGAPAYAALRLRQLGLAFESTLFVVLCHGTRRWITDVARKVRVLPGALAVTVLEQASLELADVVVSPSAYMVEWMQRQGWRLPARTLVIPYLTRSGATGEPPPPEIEHDDRFERISFFGRLEARKGVGPFVAAVNALSAKLQEEVELEFVGSTTPAWSRDHVERLLSETARRTLRDVSFATDLEQQAALRRLSRPGTLVVIPSLEDNSPNTVYECLERGIPFVASRRGGTAELIAPGDRERVLFEPTPEGIAAALSRALRAAEPLRPARPAFDADASREQWSEVIATEPPPRPRDPEQPAVDVVVVPRSSPQALSRCLSTLARQSYVNVQVIVVAERAAPEAETSIHGRPPMFVRPDWAPAAGAREAGLRAGGSPWVVFLEDEDVPEDEFLETLVRAQAASGADVVTCGLYLLGDDGRRGQHFFLGEPGGLGVLSNSYGTAALIRSSLLLDGARPPVEEIDPDWALLAGLSLSGAEIVSVPVPLVARRARPGHLHPHPSDALLVLQQFESVLPRPLESIARLAAGLAADSQAVRAAPPGGIARRVRDRLLPRSR